MPYVFPDPSYATEEGLLALGGDYEVETLLNAYEKGIFPWPVPGYPITWFCPLNRGVLFFDQIKIPKSLKKKLVRNSYNFTINQNFKEVIKECQTVSRPSEDPMEPAGTWITDELRRGYVKLHKAGYAKSVEVWSEKKTCRWSLWGAFKECICW